jgi:hypothetical protein
MNRVALALLGLTASACGLSDGDGGVDATPADPLIQLDYTGTYAVSGTWDLSRPMGGDGVGGAVADLLIDQLVSLSGVPGPLEDRTRDAIAAAIRQPVVDHVNGVVPDDLVTGSPLMVALAEIFGAIAVDGRLTLRASPGDPDRCSGTDEVTGLAASYQAQTVAVSMAELLSGTGAVTVAGSIVGTATAADALAIGQHPLEVRYGRLVAILARDLLGVDADALAGDAMAAIACAPVVAVVTGGGDRYEVSVGDASFGVSASAIDDACEAIRGQLEGAALGMFGRDAGIRLGGPVRLADRDGDDRADDVTSVPGYGGAITALPIAVEPQVTAAFSARR